MNSITISGRLVYQPEAKTTSTGSTVLKTRIAVERHDKNKTTDFINVQAWNKTAELIVKYFNKGDGIEITGKLQTESYEKQDGTKVSDVFIYITEIGFPLSKRTDAEPQRRPTAQPSEAQDTPIEIGDDLPFQI